MLDARAASVGFAICAALVVALVGPTYGGLITILAFPLVFRRADLVELGSLLTTYVVVYVALFLVGVGVTDVAPDATVVSSMAGACVPISLSAGSVVLTRHRGGESVSG